MTATRIQSRRSALVCRLGEPVPRFQTRNYVLRSSDTCDRLLRLTRKPRVESVSRTESASLLCYFDRERRQNETFGNKDWAKACQCFLYAHASIGFEVWRTGGGNGTASDLPILVTSLLPRRLLFLIDNRQTGSILVKMSADILYSPKAIDALQFLFTSALGAWR